MISSEMGECVTNEKLNKLKELSAPRRNLPTIIENGLKDIELILSTRLTDESFREIINFEKAVKLKKTNDEIRKVLVSLININVIISYCIEFYIYLFTRKQFKLLILLISQEYVFIDLPETNCSA